MVDYARFYLDPRAHVSHNMTGLANAAKYRESMGLTREKLAQDMYQQGLTNELNLAKYGLEERKQDQLQGQRGFENRQALERFGLDTRAEDRLREKTAQEVAEKHFSMLAGMMDGVDDENSYKDYRSMLKSFVDNKMLPGAFYENTPETYNPDEFGRAKEFVKGIAGKERWGQATTDDKGRLRQTRTDTGEEKVLSEGASGKWQPSYKTFLLPDGATKTVDINKDEVGEEWVPWSKDATEPEMTKAEAMKEVTRLEALALKIEGTGGLEEGLFAELAKSSPTLAAALKGTDKTFAKEAIAKYVRHLNDNFIKETGTDDPAGLRDVLKDL